MMSKQPGRQSIQHLAKYYFPNVGGMETATKELAEVAVSLGYDVSCSASAAARGWKRKDYIHNGVFVRSNPTTLKLFSAPISLALLFRKIEKKSIIHIHLPNPLAEIRILFSLLCIVKAKHNIVPFLHAIPVGQGRLGNIWFKFVTAAILSRVESIFISDPFFFQSFPVLSQWSDKFIIMPFCCDPITLEEFNSLLEERLDSHTILAVGRLVPYKGFDVLIRAWARLRADSEFFKYRLKIVGEGPQKEILKNLVNELKLEGSVQLLGELDEDAKWSELKNASLFVAPSTTNAETFGISILEAMSCGLPVITSDIKTGVSSLARGGACGAVVAAGNPDDLADKLKKLLLDIRETLNSVGRSNLEYVRAGHTRKILRQKYSEFMKNYDSKSW